MNLNYLTLILIKKGISDELKYVEYYEFEDMVFRMGLKYCEVEKTLDTKILLYHLQDLLFHLENMKLVILT